MRTTGPFGSSSHLDVMILFFPISHVLVSVRSGTGVASIYISGPDGQSSPHTVSGVSRLTSEVYSPLGFSH